MLAVSSSLSSGEIAGAGAGGCGAGGAP